MEADGVLTAICHQVEQPYASRGEDPEALAGVAFFEKGAVGRDTVTGRASRDLSDFVVSKPGNKRTLPE